MQDLRLVLTDGDLSMEAKVVYAYITTMKVHEILTDCLYDKVQEALDFSKSQSNRAFQELYDSGLLDFYEDWQLMAVKLYENNEK